VFQEEQENAMLARHRVTGDDNLEAKIPKK
jgi:hypothetical protein